VLFCGGGGTRQAVVAIRAGAHDFVERPVSVEELTLAVEKVISRSRLLEEPDAPHDTAARGLFGTSKAMRHVLDVIERVASSDATALIRGESGTGKELVARALHRESSRSHAPFVKVHAAGLPETLLESELFGYERGAFTGATARKPGRVELAEGGTLFLDEIGDVSPAVQVKLLRLLQDREYERLGGAVSLKADVRFIVATHRDLDGSRPQLGSDDATPVEDCFHAYRECAGGSVCGVEAEGSVPCVCAGQRDRRRFSGRIAGRACETIRRRPDVQPVGQPHTRAGGMGLQYGCCA
jgi:DNA-binding NtrC family response regulator